MASIPFASLDNRCPLCRVPLVVENNNLVCHKCNEKFIFHYINNNRKVIISKSDTYHRFNLATIGLDDILIN